MIPKIIHQIHIGRAIPLPLVPSFSRMNPSWTHIVWDESMLGAVGLVVAEHQKWGPSAAGITNYLRLKLVEKFGGIWADTDCECLKPLDLLLANEAFTAEQDREGGFPRYCNAFFGARAGHPWISHQLSLAEHFVSADAAWGVYLMTAAMSIGDLPVVIPKHLIYPWLWHDAAEKHVPHPDSLIQHFWSGSWVRK